MVAKDEMNSAAITASLDFEAHDEVHYEAGVSSAIEEVPGEHQVCFASTPGEVVVDNVGYLESFD
jgi:hypothetical protein